MKRCPKCGRYGNFQGEFCEECSKAFPFYDPAADGPSWEEYIAGIEKFGDAAALALADEELIIYKLYKANKQFTPTLRAPYNFEYPWLEEWFADRFFQLLYERMSSEGAISNSLIDEFKEFYENICSVSLYNDPHYPSLTDSTAYLLLKKALKEIGVDPTLLDEISYTLSQGSALFLIELFTRLKAANTIRSFMSEINGVSKNIPDFARRPIVLLSPWPHQSKAIESWEQNGQRGILEMATATGKTLVGLMAIERLYSHNQNLRALVLCHSTAILNQWRDESIEKLGLPADRSQSYKNPIVLQGQNGALSIQFETIQTAHKDPSQYSADLLIVDEVHHEAAPKFKEALKVAAPYRLGLSATIEGGERLDILERYLGPVVYTFGLKEAMETGIIPSFKWLIHPTQLDVEEEAEYTKLTREINTLFLQVSQDRTTISKIAEASGRIDGNTFEISNLNDFIELCRIARYKEVSLPEEWELLQVLVLKRRWILHKSMPKIDWAIELAKAYAPYKKCVLFAMDIESCETIHQRVMGEEIPTYVIHSRLNDRVVRSNIRRFKQEKSGILIAPKMLDEGINIPDAEIGINVASTKTRLQLIQRIGRILRKVEGKSPEFHHFIALPQSDSYINQEDGLNYLDEASWVQNTALRMGLTAEVVAEDKFYQGFHNVRENAERLAHEALSGKKQTLHFGTINVGNILSKIPDDVLRKLIAMLSEVPESRKISDEEWAKMLRGAYDNRTSLNIEGIWWVLIAGHRCSASIGKIIKDFLNTP